MSTAGNETLDRIQQEIQESLEREEELRKKYNLLNNNDADEHLNGYEQSLSPEPPQSSSSTSINESGKSTPTFRQNTSRHYGSSSSKGVMEKFLKMRGKLNIVSMKPRIEPQPTWNHDLFQPAKVTIEPGKPIRNGFISAEEKMRRELQEFQRREEELRKERRKSQPDLMAALESENENLKPARSISLLCSNEDLTNEIYSSSTSLKSVRSTDLCDPFDEEERGGTSSLIKRFENLNSQS